MKRWLYPALLFIGLCCFTPIASSSAPAVGNGPASSTDSNGYANVDCQVGCSGGGGGSGNQGTANTISNAWPVRFCDTVSGFCASIDSSGRSTVNFASGSTVSLGTGSQVIGSISNIAFGITGTLPAFASTPTFNIGTTGGIALDASLQSFLTGIDSTTAPGKLVVVGGESSDATPQYNPIPLTNGGVAVVISGAITNTVFGVTLPYNMNGGPQTAGTANGVGVFGVYNTSSPTLTNGQVVPLQLDVNGNLKTNSTVSGTVAISNFPTPSPLGQALSSASIPVVPASDWLGRVNTGGKTTSGAITAGLAGPTVIKASAGVLVSGLITTAGTTGTVILYDNASACSGTIIGEVAGTTALATMVAGAPPIKWDMIAVNGITACGGTGSAAITVGYN
jgi:hypothetical protein